MIMIILIYQINEVQIMKLMNAVVVDVLVEDNKYLDQFTQQQQDVIKDYYKRVMTFLSF